MKPTVIEDVSEILDTFNLREISELLDRQIELTNDDIMLRTDYFKPLYYRYRSIVDTDDNPIEIKEEATNRFHAVCLLFIRLICDRFALDIDTDWIKEHIDQAPGVVTALYSFFIKDLNENMLEVIIRYVEQHEEQLYEIFEDRKNKKDAATLVKKRKFSLEKAVILANIYDVSKWILQQMGEEQFIHYLNPDYVALKVVYGLIDEGLLGGHFMDTINEVYSEQIGLRGEICLKTLLHFEAAAPN